MGMLARITALAVAAAWAAPASEPKPASEFTILFFTAEWCGPCRAVHSTLERIARAQGERVKLVAVDFDTAQDEVRRWDVHEIPVVIVIGSDGKVMMRAQGGDPETLRGIQSGLESLLKPQQKRGYRQ